MPRASMPLKNRPYAAVSDGDRRVVITDWAVGEERRDQRAESVDLDSNTGIARRVGEPGGELRAEPCQVLIEPGREFLHRPQASGHREGIAGKRARLVHRSRR